MASHGTGPSFAPLRRKEYRSRRILRQESDRVSPQHAYPPDHRRHAEVAVAGVDGERDGAVAAAVAQHLTDGDAAGAADTPSGTRLNRACPEHESPAATQR